MRNLQKFLLVVGAAALGAAVGCLALFCYIEITGWGSNHGKNDLGTAGLGILLAIGSAAIGAIFGFVTAIWWIRKHDSGLWPSRIWIGITLGLVAGVALHYGNKLPPVPTLVEIFDHWQVAAVLTAALATLGGTIAKLTGPRSTH